MILHACNITAIAAFGMSCSTSAQTVVATYSSDKSSSTEVFAFDYETGASLRIRAFGNILLYTPQGKGFEGVAGVASLSESSRINAFSSPGNVLLAIPAAGLYQLEHFAGFRRLPNRSRLGGSAYTGEFPLGDPHLGQLEQAAAASNLPNREITYTLDSEGHLRRIQRENESKAFEFDVDRSNGPRESAAVSIGDGSLRLSELIVHSQGDLSVFDPDNVIDHARRLAFARAQAERTIQREEVANALGRNRIESAIETQLGNRGVDRVRVPTILTGLALMITGVFAWWKRR